MNNTEYLKIYLDNIKLGLKHNRNIDAPDEFLNRLLEKYSSYEGSPNDIVEELNVEIEEFIRKEVERKLEEDKVEAEKLAKEETEKLRNEEMVSEEEKAKIKVIDEANSAEKEEQAEEEKEEEIEINESQEQEAEEEVVEETEERETQFNNADINMMLIAMASTPEELQEAISKIPNLNARLKDFDLNPEEFENTKRGLFAMYKNGLSDEERKFNGLAFESMEEYRQFAQNLGDNFDSAVLENGKKVDINSNFDVEGVKDDIALDTKENIDMDATNDFSGKVVADNGNKHEQETRDVVKAEVNLDNDMDIMFNDPEENNMTKEVEEKAPEKSNAKVLKLTPPSEKGFAYSPAINITIMLLLLVFFMIVIVVML